MTQADRMIKARAALITGQPFFGTLALYLKVVETEACETMATDGEYLYWAPSFTAKLTSAELEGVYAHEVLHCAYKHHTRRQDREPDLWNQAADYAINRDLIASGFKLPKGGLISNDYNGMGAEEIYRRLKADRKKATSQAQGRPSSGQGGLAGSMVLTGAGQGPGSPANGSGKAGKFPIGLGAKPLGQGGWVMDAAPKHQPAKTAAVEAEWDRRVKQAVSVAMAQNAGNIPGNLMSVVENTKQSKVNWQDELRRFIDAKTRVDFSWTKPNKRYLNSGFILPGVEADGIDKLGIVIDTSGSITEEQLSTFLAEVRAARDAGAIADVICIQCDTDVRHVDRFSQGDEIKLVAHGRGGTRFSPALQWFKDNEPDVVALIYFTDLECYDWGTQPEVPLMWAAYGYDSRVRQLAKNVPFGEVLHIEA